MAFANHQVFSVAVFLCDRAYGGPEEGGWWYDCGEPDATYDQFTRYFPDEGVAIGYADRLNRRLCDKLNEGRPSINSVLSEGRYRARVGEGAPAAYPATRPHYE